MGYAMRTDRYRYIEWQDRRTREVVATELYDHDSDPQENTNIADQASNKVIARSNSAVRCGPCCRSRRNTFRRSHKRPQVIFQESRRGAADAFLDHARRAKSERRA